MNLLLPVVAALVSILVLPGWSFFFDVVPKIVVAIAGAALALVLAREKPVPQPRSSQWFGALIAAQAMITLLATLFSTHRTASVMGSAWRRTGLFAEVAVLILVLAGASHWAADRARLRIFLRITVMSALPIAIYGILQYFGIDPLLNSTGYHFGEGRFTIVRPPSTFGHAAYFATYLLFAVFAGAAVALSEASGAWKVAGITASGLATFAIVLSGTRAALAGWIAGALFLIARRKLDWRWAAAVVGLLILITGLYFSPAGEQLRARVFWSSEDLRGGARLLLWRDTLRMAREHWLIGYGPETFTIEFPRHQSIELARAFPDFYHESPHNIFLDALVSKGVLGLLPTVALAALGITVARGPIGAAFIAMLVSQQFTTFTLPTELYFYACLAILVSDFKPRQKITVPYRTWKWAIAIPLVAFAIYLGTGDLWLAAARRALDRGDLDGAAQALGRARAWNATADIYFSRRFVAQTAADPALRYRAWQYAMHAAARAPNTADDRQNAFVNLAAFQATEDNAPGVKQSLRQAIAVAPNWFKPHWLLAQVLAREGRMPEAEAEARAAVDRDGGKDPEVARTLDELRKR